jgi:hypothetical protein
MLLMKSKTAPNASFAPDAAFTNLLLSPQGMADTSPCSA